MAEKFKLKYLFISLILIAVITSCTAFSVSYAAWVAPAQNNAISVSVGIGGGSYENRFDGNIFGAGVDPDKYVNGDGDNRASSVFYKQMDGSTFSPNSGGIRLLGQYVTNESGVKEFNNTTPSSGYQTVYGKSKAKEFPFNANRHAWRNSAANPQGFTSDIYLEEGTVFIVGIFNRVFDPTNTGIAQTDQGYAVIQGIELSGTGNASVVYNEDGTVKHPNVKEYFSYRTAATSKDDYERVIFEVKKTGYYRIDICEGTQNPEFDLTKTGTRGGQYSFGYDTNCDVMTVAYRGETKPN